MAILTFAGKGAAAELYGPDAIFCVVCMSATVYFPASSMGSVPVICQGKLECFGHAVVEPCCCVCPSFVFRAHSCCVTHWTRHRHGSRQSKVQKSSCLSHPNQRVFSSRHLSMFFIFCLCLTIHATLHLYILNIIDSVDSHQPFTVVKKSVLRAGHRYTAIIFSCFSFFPGPPPPALSSSPSPP